MKHLVTKNSYKGSNFFMEVSDDCKTVTASSYGWWIFLNTDSVGNIVVNRATYSHSSSGHQRDASSVLSRLAIRPHLALSRTKKSLGNIEYAILNEISLAHSDIRSLVDQINTKGSHKAKNIIRQSRITEIEYEIKDLERFLSDYLNKKTLPVKHSDPYNTHADDFAKYYVKPNGKIQANELNKTLSRIKYYARAPRSIDAIREALKISTTDLNSLETILCYQYSEDLNDMIPHVDSDQRPIVNKFISKHVPILSTHTLDKLHTFLTNIQNKKTRVPSEARKFHVAEKLQKINHKDLNLLDDSQKLRAEGRRQNHCIGGLDYQKKCSLGYQALNFKGYTFFLSPSLEIVQTNGRFNCQTPDSVISELKTLLSA